MQTVKTRQEAGVQILTLENLPALSDRQSDEYRAAIYRAVEECPTPTAAVDLADVGIVTSSGVALLIGIKRRFEDRKIQFVLFGLQPYLNDVLSVMKLDKFFTIVPDLPTAIKLAGASTTPPDFLDTATSLSS
ncbi:STAS domain-containing protein [Isosphaeraceae bacterium EP7]